MAVVEYDELRKKGLPRDLVIPESTINMKQIAVWADGIKDVVENTLEAIKGNK